MCFFHSVGAAFTRFQTLHLKRAFPQVLADQLISYGSCQFPTLGFVVERYKQVQAFIPEPFWKIKGNAVTTSIIQPSINQLSLLVVGRLDDGPSNQSRCTMIALGR